MKKDLILGLDIGSSSVRAALFDDAGNLQPKSLVKIERKLKATADGGSEIEAEAAFRQVVKAIDELLVKTKSVKGGITHVASCTFWHNLMGLDASGKPTTPVFGWADNRSREHVKMLRKKLNESETHNRTGARFHSSFWPAKLLWLRNESPEVWTKTTQWISLGDYFALRLNGSAETSISIASGTGIFNIRTNDWDDALLRFLKLKRSQLSPVADDSATFGLNVRFAKRWPRLADAEWFYPVADGAANNVGSGCVQRYKAALMIGTSGAMRVVYTGEPPQKIPSGLWCYRVDRKRVIIGGALSDGGGLYEWLTATLKLPKNVDSIIGKRKIGEHGLTFLPFLAGERSTGYDEYATGVIAGLCTFTNAVDILQAGMEAVAYRFAEILSQLESVVKIREIVASGGAVAASTVWTKMIADILGRDLILSNVPEASMRGAVLLALETIGTIEK